MNAIEKVLGVMQHNNATQVRVERGRDVNGRRMFHARVTLEYRHGPVYAYGDAGAASQALEKACARAMEVDGYHDPMAPDYEQLARDAEGEAEHLQAEGPAVQ